MRRCFLMSAAMLGVLGVAFGQSPADHDHMAMGQAAASGAPVATGPAAEVQRSYASAKGNILKSADKMPAADFGYKPEPDIRTFARVLNHVTEGTGAKLRCDEQDRSGCDGEGACGYRGQGCDCRGAECIVCGVR
ncbi:MAG: hypothetical protein WDN23_07535 [Edaphobacter sp.]